MLGVIDEELKWVRVIEQEKERSENTLNQSSIQNTSISSILISVTPVYD